jgi:hypothetical protein
MMGEGISNKWRDFISELKLWLARIAIKWCGIPLLYWASPLEWEKYMSTGEPLTPEVWFNRGQ